MKTKILSLAVIFFAALTLSACTAKDKLKAKILNKVDQKVQEEKAELTDDQLLKEMESSPSSNLDNQFKQLESEIK